MNLASSVKLKKNGKFPIVSMVIKNKTKEFMKVFNILLFRIFSWQYYDIEEKWNLNLLIE